jgi:hypothetical protein
MDIAGATVSVGLEYTPHASDIPANDGGLTTYNGARGSGMGAGVTIAYDALKVGAYAAEIDNVTVDTGDDQRDNFEGVWYASYSFGPVAIGYSESYLENGVADTDDTPEAATAAKTVRTATGIFESESMSIAFNVNDNLSVSYTETEDTYDAQSNVNGGTEVVDVTQTTEAFQVAYSMGAMSVKAYNMETKNPGYDSNASTASVTEIALGLAF